MKLSIVVFFATLGCLSAQASVHAERVTIEKQFNLNSYFEIENKVYFNCQSVEDATAKLLTQLGATDIQVHCTGGIQEGLPPVAWDSSVEASFSVLKASPEGPIAADYKAVSIHSIDGCILLNQLFTGVSDAFDIRQFKGTQKCSSVHSRYQVELETLF